MILKTILNPITPFLIVGAFCLGMYSSWWVTSNYYQAKMTAAAEEAVRHENKIVKEQGEISKQTQAKKDELQTRYDRLLSAYRGVRNANTKTADPTPAVPSQGFRLLEPDVEFLIRFAKECANTEIERNDVIQKYEKLDGN
jgi:hypothetical protein